MQLKVLYFKEREQIKRSQQEKNVTNTKRVFYFFEKMIKNKCNTNQQLESRYKQIDTDAFLHMLHRTSYGNPHRT